jgi:hypothetical protein
MDLVLASALPAAGMVTDHLLLGTSKGEVVVASLERGGSVMLRFTAFRWGCW